MVSIVILLPRIVKGFFIKMQGRMNFYSKTTHFLSDIGVFVKKSVIFHARRPCDAKSASSRIRSLQRSNTKTARTVQMPQDGINKPGHTESKASDK